MIGNEPDFPFQSGWKPNEREKFPEGMTIRQYFVAQAMKGLLANSNVTHDERLFAIACCTIADACLNLEAETRK